MHPIQLLSVSIINPTIMKIVIPALLSLSAFSFWLPSSLPACWYKQCSHQHNSCIQSLNCIETVTHCNKECKRDNACTENCIMESKNSEAMQLWKCGESYKCQFNQKSAPPLTGMKEDNDICSTLHCSNASNWCALLPPCVQLYQNCDSVCNKQKKCMVTCAQNTGNGALIALCDCIVKNNCKF